MKKNIYIKLSIVTFLFLSSIFSYSQDVSNQGEYYKWFDSQISIENTSLNNGIRYKEKFRTKNGNHKFYLSAKFIKGDIVYDGQPFYDIEMKYDLFEDQIIINLPTQAGYSLFQLIKDHIESFNIEGTTFIKLADNEVNNSTNTITGFYEISLQSPNLILYNKHLKIRIKFLDNKVVFSEFKNKNEYYIYYQNSYFLIKRKSDLTKIFPLQKKIITSYYNSNKFLQKSNYDLFMIQLSEKISSSVNKTSNIN